MSSEIQKNVAWSDLANNRGRVHSAAGQGRVIKRVRLPPRKEGHPPSEFREFRSSSGDSILNYWYLSFSVPVFRSQNTATGLLDSFYEIIPFRRLAILRYGHLNTSEGASLFFLLRFRHASILKHVHRARHRSNVFALAALE
jgi:hypothetical protein